MADLTGAETRIAAATALADAAMGDAAAAAPTSPEGAPETGTSAAGQPDPSTPAAPAADQAFDAPFNLADVPEGVREHVERYNKQLQGAFTQKTTALAEQLREIDGLTPQIELLRRAAGEDPNDRIAALNELLDPFGIEIPDDEDETLLDAGAEPTSTVDPELKQTLDYLLEREKAREAQQQTDGQERFRQSVATTVDTALGEFATTAGYESADKLPEHVRAGILDRAIALPKLPTGLPDMAAAITAYEAHEAAVVSAYVAKKGLTPPTPDLSGEAGRAQIDLSDPKQRLARAEEVVGRHL
jgi:hypothetical protein